MQFLSLYVQSTNLDASKTIHWITSNVPNLKRTTELQTFNIYRNKEINILNMELEVVLKSECNGRGMFVEKYNEEDYSLMWGRIKEIYNRYDI